MKVSNGAERKPAMQRLQTATSASFWEVQGDACKYLKRPV
jgi:hypothetical protein